MQKNNPFFYKILIFLITLFTFLGSSFFVLGEENAAVYFSPSSKNVKPGSDFKIKIEIDPKGKGISSGEINLEFDSKALHIIDLEPGDILGQNPIVGIKQIDNINGKAKYALARTGKTSSPTLLGVFTIIKFEVLKTVQIGQTLKIELTSAGLADENFREITNINLQSAKLKVTHGFLIYYLIVIVLILILVAVFVVRVRKKRKSQ